MSNLLEFAFYDGHIFAGFLPKTIASKSRVGRAGNDSGWKKNSTQINADEADSPAGEQVSTYPENKINILCISSPSR